MTDPTKIRYAQLSQNALKRFRSASPTKIPAYSNALNLLISDVFTAVAEVQLPFAAHVHVTGLFPKIARPPGLSTPNTTTRAAVVRPASATQAPSVATVCGVPDRGLVLDAKRSFEKKARIVVINDEAVTTPNARVLRLLNGVSSFFQTSCITLKSSGHETSLPVEKLIPGRSSDWGHRGNSPLDEVAAKSLATRRQWWLKS